MPEQNGIMQVADVKRYFTAGDTVTKALDGVSLNIAEGEFVSFMGPSGSGKSTLMHILGFLDRLTGGSYYFRGKDVSTLDDEALALMRRYEVGFVFQAFNLLSNATVLENVMLPMVYSGVPLEDRQPKAFQALSMVGLEHRANYRSNVISGGEKQRTAIARALVNEPSVIFADEPTGNLDTKSGAEVLNLLQVLNDQGRTVVMVTHEQEAAEFADRIIRLRDGKLDSDGMNHNKRTGTYNK